MDLAFISPSARDNRIMTSTSTVSRGLLGSANRQLLLCRAALGVWFDFGEETVVKRKLPPKESVGVLYDSVRGGPHRPPHSFRTTLDLSRDSGDYES